jgi:Insertion element 4 transposase N-terminal/Transposase DDE domain
VEWVRLLVEARSTKISFYEGAAMADSVMPARSVPGGGADRGRLRSAVTTVMRSVTVAAGVFAPGHLGELTRQVPFELVDAVLEQTRATERRLRMLPSRVGVYFVVALALFPALGSTKVWAKLVTGLDVGLRVSVSDKALRDVRRRVGAAPVKALFETLAGPVAQPSTPGVRFGRYRTVAFDGCVSIKVPDTDRNRAWLGKLRAALGVTGYPVVKLMTLVETGTRALLGAVFGPPATGETDYARRLLGLLDRDMLVLIDRGFDAAEFLTELAGTGAAFLARLRSTRTLPVLARCDDGSHLSRIGELTVRVITADVTVTCADGTRYVANYRLATTLTDPRRHPARALIGLYHERWEHEIAYLALRHTLGAGLVLRSTDPAGLKQEMWAQLTVYQALRRAMVTAVESRPGTDPDRASFATALHTARDLITQAANIIDDEGDPIGAIGRAVLDDLHPPRRARTSVRKVKSPLSRYNKKDPYRPEHSTPITSITATITDPDTEHATRQPKSLTTALGP